MSCPACSCPTCGQAWPADAATSTTPPRLTAAVRSPQSAAAPSPASPLGLQRLAAAVAELDESLRVRRADFDAVSASLCKSMSTPPTLPQKETRSDCAPRPEPWGLFGQPWGQGAAPVPARPQLEEVDVGAMSARSPRASLFSVRTSLGAGSASAQSSSSSSENESEVELLLKGAGLRGGGGGGMVKESRGGDRRSASAPARERPPSQLRGSARERRVQGERRRGALAAVEHCSEARRRHAKMQLFFFAL